MADPDGTGRAARVPGLAIGGKTGTAQIMVPTGKFNPRTGVRLFRTDHITWFVSFAPIDSPRHVVVVMVESGESGGSPCAPLHLLGATTGDDADVAPPPPDDSRSARARCCCLCFILIGGYF